MANFIEEIYKFNKERNLLNTLKLSSELGYDLEEISEALKRFDNNWEFVDSLGDVIVFATGTILKLFEGDKKYAEMLISNVAKNILVDHKTQLNGKDLLKLGTDEIYNCDILCLYDTIQESVGEQRYALNKFTKFHILGDLTEKVALILQILSRGELKTNDDKILLGIYFSTIIVLALHYLRIIGYDPFIVLDEIMKQNFSRKGSIDPVSGKFVKDKNQDPSTLYKPNFENAKLK